MVRHCLVFAALLAAVGCQGPLPPFEHEGEHIVVATDVVDEVCAGTLAYLDSEYERVSDKLGFDFGDEPLKVAILEPEQASQFCPPGRSCASRFRGQEIVVLRREHVKRLSSHEMVHVRLNRHRSGSVPLFSEGIAEALSPAGCAPHSKRPSVSELLTVERATQLPSSGYYAGGELVTYLVQKHGMEHVLAFIESLIGPGVLERTLPQSEVTKRYKAHFGTHLAEDLRQSPRAADSLAPDSVGCTGPALHEKNGAFALEATLLCESTRTENDFNNQNEAYIEWRFSNSHDRHLRLDGHLPPSTHLELVACHCDLHNNPPSVIWNETDGSPVLIPRGEYIVRWRGPVNTPEHLDVALKATQ